MFYATSVSNTKQAGECGFTGITDHSLNLFLSITDLEVRTSVQS